MSEGSFFGEGTVKKPNIKLLLTNHSEEQSKPLASFKFSNNSLLCSICLQSFSSLRSATEHWTEEVKSGQQNTLVNQDVGSDEMETIELLPEMLETVQDKSILSSDEEAENRQIKEEVDELEENYTFLPLKEVDTVLEERVDSRGVEAALDQPKPVIMNLKKRKIDSGDSMKIHFREKDSHSGSGEDDNNTFGEPMYDDSSYAGKDTEEHIDAKHQEELLHVDCRPSEEQGPTQPLADFTKSTSSFEMEMEVEEGENPAEEKTENKTEEINEDQTENEFVDNQIKSEELDIENDDDHEDQFPCHDQGLEVKTEETVDEEDSNIFEEGEDKSSQLFTQLNEEFICYLCDYTADIKATIWSHVKTNHNQEYTRVYKLYRAVDDEFVCIVCGYRAEKKNTIWKHVKRRHNPENDSTTIHFDCVFCEFKNGKLEVLRKHVSIHHPEKGFNKSDHEKTDDKNQTHFESCKAPDCFYIASTKLDLLHHKITIHESVPDYFQKTGAQYKVDLESNCFICNICQHKAELEDSMKAHVRRKHTPGGRTEMRTKYKCAYCDLKGVGYDGLRKHVKNHHPGVRFKKSDFQESKEVVEVKFSCDDCNFVGSNHQSLIAHRRSFHSTEDRARILKDKDYTEESGWFLCLTCDYRTKRQNTIRVHVDRRHSKNSCFLCEVTVDDIDMLREHVMEQHEGRETKCEYCEKTFTSRESLSKHQKYSHPEKVDSSATLLHCNQCSFTVYGAKRLERHQKNSHSVARFPCDLCDHVAKNADCLRSHKKVIHEGIKIKIKSHACHLCDFSGTPKYLKIHQAEKHNIGVKVEKYYCDQCDFNTVYQSSLHTHIKWMHLKPNEKPKQIFKKDKLCDYCDYSTTTNQLLNNHIESKHLGIKYDCDQCSYQCSSAQVLRWHMIAKHGEGFPCPHCSYRATVPNQLKEHVQARHENVKFYCDKCNFATSFKTNLRAHVKKTHPEK